MKKPSVGEASKYELHVQVLIGEVPVRNFVGNDQDAAGTVEPLENKDIFYGIFSDEYFVSPSVQFFEDFRDVEHALQNTSRVEFYPILFAKCVHASELKLQTNNSLMSEDASIPLRVPVNFLMKKDRTRTMLTACL